MKLFWNLDFGESLETDEKEDDEATEEDETDEVADDEVTDDKKTKKSKATKKKKHTANRHGTKKLSKYSYRKITVTCQLLSLSAFNLNSRQKAAQSDL